jgi:hypothetical protein
VGSDRVGDDLGGADRRKWPREGKDHGWKGAGERTCVAILYGLELCYVMPVVHHTGFS